MSIWADREILGLIEKVKILEEKVRQLQAPQPPQVRNLELHQLDKRTKEYKEWKNANS